MILKIAICDDEPSVVEQIKGLITKACEALPIRFTAACFLSGEDLVAQLNKGSFYDLIYLDISMKELSGLDVGKHMREQLLNRRTGQKSCLNASHSVFSSSRSIRKNFQNIFAAPANIWEWKSIGIWSLRKYEARLHPSHLKISYTWKARAGSFNWPH